MAGAGPKRYRNLHLIQKRLGPAMYRKSREDIAEWLPDKIEIEMPVVLDRTTMRLHDLIRHDLSDAIDKALGWRCRVAASTWPPTTGATSPRTAR